MRAAIGDEATVLIDGRQRGVTPLRIPALEAGAHQIELRLANHQSWSGTLRPQERTTLRPTLAPLPGTLRVLVQPWGSLLVNGTRELESTNAPYTSELAPGTYRLRATHPSYGVWDKTVQLAPGQQQEVFFDFQQIYRIQVISPPFTNAEIVLDGEPTGTFTPIPIEVRAGTHTIEVRKEGYRLEGGPRQITVEENTTEPIVFTLVEAGNE